MTTPVVFIVFNRPDTTLRVFECIRRYRPQHLLVIADGPRTGRAGETERCAEVRQIIDGGVDWPCQVERCWSDINLGCRNRISSGLTWAFSRVEAAIILEDDCLPDPSFFPYCEELLHRFADDERIMSISGTNFLTSAPRGTESYRFSRIPHVWGWAGWQRAWRHYDVTIHNWPAIRDGGWLDDLLGDKSLARRWRKIFDKVARNGIDTWDYQWVFTCWSQSGLSILPNRNLISNIGFGAHATHTTIISQVANLPTEEMAFPIRHPAVVIRDNQSDLMTDLRFIPPLPQRILGCLRRILSGKSE